MEKVSHKPQILCIHQEHSLRLFFFFKDLNTELLKTHILNMGGGLYSLY